jgi:hypothetical protein
MDPIDAIIALLIAVYVSVTDAGLTGHKYQEGRKQGRASKGVQRWLYAGTVTLLAISCGLAIVGGDIANQTGNAGRLVFGVMAAAVAVMVWVGSADSHLRVFWVTLVVLLAISISITLVPFLLHFLPSWHIPVPKGRI